MHTVWVFLEKPMKLQEMRKSSDNFHARTKNAVVKLVKGKESAIQLQNILHQPVQEREPVSVQQLAVQIFRSFSDSLSELASGQISTVDCGGSSCSAGANKKRGVKDRRGRYKRRRTSDSWVTVSPTVEDGCVWRKYGQKTILDSEYPRCYFRCTHKQNGCQALKQVQRVEGDEVLYQTTYINHHTCKETLNTPPESDPVDNNLICFQTLNKPSIRSSVKQEDNTSEARSTLEDPWFDGLDPIWAPYQDEVESSLHGLDMEVNQLSDILNLHYFD